MENRQNKPPKGGAASGHGGQKFHTDSEQAKLHKSKLRMESREERLNKAREKLAKQKPPKKPGPIKRIARIAGHETHAFLHGKVIRTVEVDMMMFGRSIFFRSFLYSGLITLAFALLVNGMMYYRLKKIDMIESLKSVE